jgi:uncharacterized protein YjgD (DUF1641 family)
MTATLAEVDKASIETLLEKLENPEVVAALSSLLDNVDLLAVLIAGLNGLVQRSELMGEAIIDGFGDIRTLTGSVTAPEEVMGLNIKTVLGDVSELTKALPELTSMLPQLTSILPKVAPGLAEIADAGLIDEFIRSGLTEARSVDQLGNLLKGVAKGINSKPVEISGVLSLVRQVKDPDVSRGLGFALGLLQAIGAQIGQSKNR